MWSGKGSTTQRGNDFRDLVASLLRTKYPMVEIEKSVAGKNVDVYIEYVEFGKSTRVAFECKMYEASIGNSALLEKIYPHYKFLIDTGQVDYVVLVANKDLTPQARTVVETLPGFRFRTLEQLQEDIIGIGSYIRSLETLFDSDPGHIASYHVPARFVRDGNAVEALDLWLASDDSPALAVLGGYGTGKTTLARHYASHRAKEFSRDPTNRMPIVISIGSEVYETSLESIFGKAFSSQHWSNNFRFESLRQLNRDGRLLIIFDGFDEMKHAMTSSDFRSNFREINRLITDRVDGRSNAKVLLLGRPNALPSDERMLVFRGQRYVAEQIISDPDWPVWTEKEVAFLNQEEVHALLSRYFMSEQPDLPPEDADLKARDLMDMVSFDLLRRPIQARLLAVLALRGNVSLRGIGLAHVYHYFIEDLLDRDMERRARKSVASESRARFQRRLAFWSWTQKERSFRREDIPQDLYEDLAVEGAIDDQGKLNELIVSTLTEEKDLGFLFFAHRSLHEYLVAQYLVELAKPETVILAFGSLTDEILQFMRAMRNIEFFRKIWVGVTSGKPKGDLEEVAAVRTYLLESDFFIENFLGIYERQQGGPVIHPYWSLLALAKCHARKNDPRILAYMGKEAVRSIVHGEEPYERALGMFLLLAASDLGDAVDLVAAAHAARYGRLSDDPEYDYEADGSTFTLRDFRGLILRSFPLLPDGGAFHPSFQVTFQLAAEGVLPGAVQIDLRGRTIDVLADIDAKSGDFVRRLESEQARSAVRTKE